MPFDPSTTTAPFASGRTAVVIARAHRRTDGAIDGFEILEANERAATALARRCEALPGLSLFEVFSISPDWELLWAQCCSVLITGESLETTWHAPTPEAPMRWLQRQLLRVHGDSIVIAWHDVTTDRLQRVALEASEARHRDLFDGNGAIQLLVEIDTARIVDVNPAAAAFYGWPRETMRAMYITDVEVELLEQWHDATSSLALGAGLRVQRDHRIATGELRQVDAFIVAVEIAVEIAVEMAPRRVAHIIVQDITDRLRAERQARESEEVGRLAAGIAHDFNNLLTVIRGSTSMLREDVGPTSPYADDLDAIERATVRAEELTRRLHAMGRR